MRCYLRGYRIHHGLAGALLALAGVVLVIHDRADFPWPLIDPPQRLDWHPV